MKKSLIYMIIFAIGILGTAALLSGCGEKGLDVAYKDLQEEFQTKNLPDDDDQSESKNPVENADTNITEFTYDKKNDTLQVTLDFEKVDADKFFEILNDDIEDTDIGNLQILKVGTNGYTYSKPVYSPSGNTNSNDKDDKYIAYMKKFGKALGKLKCKSMKCIDVSGIIDSMQTSDWAKILKKTDSLYAEMSNLNSYFTDDKSAKRLSKVEKLRLKNSGTYYNLERIEGFSGLKEVSFSAGLTSADKKSNKESGIVMLDSYSGYSSGTSGLANLAKVKGLENVFFFPELKTWDPNNKYYSALLSLQIVIPDKKTNLWKQQDESADKDSEENKDSNKDSNKEKGAVQSKDPVAFRDINVRAEAGDKFDATVQNTLRALLEDVSETSYKAGKSFKKKKGSGKIKGKCLVYIAYPSSNSSERNKQWNKERFYKYNNKVLTTELDKAKIDYPGGAYDVDTFVYVYPRFSQYGTYDKGTIGYTQKTNVRVYDMKNKTVYESKQIDSKNPPNRFSYYGSPPDVYYVNMSTDKVVNYLKKLK